MENDQIIAADADIDTLSRTQPRRIDRPAHRAHDAGMKVASATEAQKSSDHEDTPLLARNIDEDYVRHSENADSERESEQPEWTGAKDFEGRPWWNKPSASFGPISFGALQMVTRC